MHVRNFKIVAIPALASLTICACASNFAVYESPTSGQLSKITFANVANTQKVNLATFDDGTTCTGRRHIQFGSEGGVPPGGYRSLTVAADKKFTLFASLETIEDNEYGVDIGITGSGPAPAITRTITAIGCNARLSFEVKPDADYRVTISEPASSESCSVVVSELNEEGELAVVETAQRIFRSPRGEPKSFCEPL